MSAPRRNGVQVGKAGLPAITGSGTASHKEAFMEFASRDR